MVKKITYLHRRYLSCFLLFAIALFSYVGYKPENTAGYNDATAQLEQYSFVSCVEVYNEITVAKKTIQSSSQTALQRQPKIQRRGVGFCDGQVIALISTPTFFSQILLVLNLCIFVHNSSHRFVLRYIHDKDGQKA